MPDVLHGLVEDFGDDVVEVAITPRAREDHDAEFHGIERLLWDVRLTTILPSASRSGNRGGPRRIGAAHHLHRVILEGRIGEKLPAHLVDARARVLGAGRLDVELDQLAHADLAQVGEPEAVEGALHGGALRVEDPRLQAHQHADLHRGRPPSTTRRYTSWYASSTPPRSWRKRSLSSFCRVVASQRRHVSGEISSPR